MPFARAMQLLRHWPRSSLAVYSLLLASIGLASFPPVDRDEAYFAQSARQMLESGDYTDIRFQDEARYRKPILIYWLQAASAAVGGGPRRDRIAAYRMPSALATVAAALAVYETALVLFGAEVALAGAALFASTLLLQTQAHQARADALLVATVAACMWPLARAWQSAAAGGRDVGTGLAALFWVALAAGVLTKGPVAPAIVGLTVVALSIDRRSGRWLLQLRPRTGIPLLVVVAAPWPLAMYATHGSEFFVHAWQSDVWPKVLSGQESHGAPPLYYLLLLPIAFWPATIALPGALSRAWRTRRESATRFCLAWLVPAWLMFELLPTKLPHYVLPLLPPLALLAAEAVGRDRESCRRDRWLGTGLFVLASACIAVASVVALRRYGHGVEGAALPALIVLCAVLGAVAWAGPSRPRLVLRTVLVCALVANIWLYALVAPRLDRLWVVARAAHIVREFVVPERCPVVVAGYREPSVVLLLGTATEFVDPANAALRLATVPGSAALVRSDLAPEFIAALPSGRPQPTLQTTVAGVDPVHDRPLSIDVWTAPCASPASAGPAACCPVPGR